MERNHFPYYRPNQGDPRAKALAELSLRCVKQVRSQDVIM
jgi:hypothetical protein